MCSDMIIAQISDPHVMPPGPNHLGIDTAAMLTTAIERLNRLSPQPDCVLITGDLADSGSDADYAELRRRLAGLQAPYRVLPGNHDEREAFRRAFADHAYLPKDGPFLQYISDIGPLRLVALDTVIPGSLGGTLCAERLEWFAHKLQGSAGRPLIVAMHHPPMLTGIPFMDAIGLDCRDRFKEIVARHSNVQMITCGHVHRTIFTPFAGTVASTCPSTAHQVIFTLSDRAPAGWSADPPGLQLHLWQPQTGVVTHSLPIVHTQVRDFE